jgi:molecular chaperone Hsp33
MSDTLQRFVFEGAPIRGEMVHLAVAWRTVLERREYPPALQKLLGKMMAAASLLSATLKFEGSMIMQMQGNGPVQLLVVECTSTHELRATAKWREAPTTDSLQAMLGDGKFVITLVTGQGAQSYQGVVSIVGNSIAEALEHYMAQSEQLETRLWLACDERNASGMLLQKLPNSIHADTDAWNRACLLGETVTSSELLKLPSIELLRRLFHQENVRVFTAQPVSFRCSCTRDRVASMLRMLGADEVHSILDERDSVDVDCEFCGRHYRFDRVDAEQALVSPVATESNRIRH